MSLNTSGLIGNAAAPFALDFQLVGNQGTTVQITGFNFGAGGSPTGVPSCFGNCTGSLIGGVSMNAATGFFNEFAQAFNPGALLQFDLTFGNIVPPAPGGIDGPDGFSFAILTGGTSGVEIPMLPGNGSFITITLDNAVTPSITLNVNDPSMAPVIPSLGMPVVTPVTSGVPEPSTLALMGGALVVLASIRRHRFMR